MLGTVYVGDNFEMLVTDYLYWNSHQHNNSVTNITVANLGELR